MSLEFLQRPNSDAATAPVPVASTSEPAPVPVASTPEPQVNTTTAPIPVAEPTPAASTQEPVTTQEPSPAQEPDIATEEPAPAPAPPATMSYASVAASGPQQSDEEVCCCYLTCSFRPSTNLFTEVGSGHARDDGEPMLTNIKARTRRSRNPAH